MPKAAEAFRTISEVANELDVPKHVLRFWEGKFAQIKPMKRGGGRRYYRPEDVDLLRGIRHLLYGDGYTIRGVQKILRVNGIDFVKKCWREGEFVASNSDAPQIPDLAQETASIVSTDAFMSRKKAGSDAISSSQEGALAGNEARNNALQSVLEELETCKKRLAVRSK